VHKFTAGDVAVALAIIMAAIGVVVDVSRSERENPGGGWFGGTLRPATWGGFRAGLPFYVTALILLVLTGV